MDQQLEAFIQHARGKGMDHVTIRMLLLSSGWKERDIAQALSAQALDIPVPTPPDVGGAREGFLHLLTAAALYTVISYWLILIFSFINLTWPDVATTAYTQMQSEGARGVVPEAMAAVLVAFPLFIWLSSVLIREMTLMPEKARSPVRRFLTYLTLFLAAFMLAVDAITLLTYLLQGELSIRFLLKIASVLMVGGVCFTYYFKSLRMSPEEMGATAFHRHFGRGASLVVAASLVGGLMVVGSPGTERLRRLDAQRATDVKVISEEVFNATVGPDWRSPAASLSIKRPLPSTLEEVRAGARQRRPRITDPESGLPYEYEVRGEAAFRICAAFALPRDEPGDVAWNHPAGTHCFDFDALNPRR